MQLATYASVNGFVLFAGILAAGMARADELDACARIAEDARRLACFDDLASRNRAAQEPRDADKSEAPVAMPGSAPSGPAPAVSRAAPPDTSRLSVHWELEPDSKRGIFRVRPHQPNYLLAIYTDSPNDDPYRPFQRFVPADADLSHGEIAFQIGFKLKLLENPVGTPVDFWFGYTQQSFWQAGNRAASSPFRETNYQPELMAVLPLNFPLPGLRARFLNLGLVHQSNGQASTLSRSWNRIYAQLGFERPNFTLVARAWKRLNESAASDDNPDIVDYMGRGDLTGTYYWRGHEFSALARYNFDTHKGAVQLGWAFPLTERLKGYLQLFSGYGHSLIDYRHKQNTLGAGVLLDF